MKPCLFAFLSAALLAPSLLQANEPPTIPWLGDNLLPNPGFEAVTGDIAAHKHWRGSITKDTGGSIRTDSNMCLAGKQSLVLSLPRSGSSASVTSKAIPVKADRLYFFSIAFRQRGFNNTKDGRNQYQGVSANPSVTWYDKNNKRLGRANSISGFPYRPSPWDLRDGFARAPAGAACARVTIGISNHSKKHAGTTIPSRLWIDAVQFRAYRRPATPAWAKGETARVVDGVVSRSPVRSFFLASSHGFHSRGGAWSRIVIDADAERGSALEAPPNAGHGIMTHSPYFPAAPPGLYRLRARVKVADNTAGKRAGFIDIASQLAGARLMLDIQPGRFAQPDRYAVLEEDFILRDDGWWCIRLFTDGNQSWAVDSIKVFPLHELEDRQLLRIYPGTAGQVDPALRPRRGAPYKALFVAGLGYDFFRPVPAIRLLDARITVKPVWVYRGRTARLKGFPNTVKELFDYSIVYLCNLPVKCLSLRQKNFIREYVRRGGALVVLGGHQGYERGSWRGSLIEDAMPVKVASSISDGLVCFEQGKPIVLAPNVPWLEGLSSAQQPRTYFLHKTRAKPGATVVATAGGHPFAVAGTYGRGRVSCILGLANGAPADAQVAFWAWDDWTYFLRNLSWWTMHHPAID